MAHQRINFFVVNNSEFILCTLSIIFIHFFGMFYDSFDKVDEFLSSITSAIEPRANISRGFSIFKTMFRMMEMGYLCCSMEHVLPQ